MKAQKQAKTAPTISVEVKLDLETVAACVKSAATSICYGAGYWAHCERRKPDGWKRGEALCASEHHDGVEAAGPWVCIEGTDVLARGLAVLAVKAPKAFAALLTDQYDGTTGDLLIQCIVLGEIKYG